MIARFPCRCKYFRAKRPLHKHCAAVSAFITIACFRTGLAVHDAGGGVLQHNVMAAALHDGGGGNNGQLGLLLQLGDGQSAAVAHAASFKPRIKAIVPVHIAGNVCNMQKLCALAKQYNVKVIEDSAHAFPSKTQLGYAGTIGDIGVFSFYVTKTITTAEGGMVCTRDQELAKRMTVMRMHGMDRTTWDRYTSPRASWEYDIVAPGYKFNLPDVLAAIGCCQLKRAESFFEKRSKIVQKYNKAFSTLDFVQLPPDGEGNSWHLYLLRIVPEKLKIGRDDFAKALQKKGIGISVHFIPLFHFTYWKSLYPDFTALNFPNAESSWSRTVSIPLWPDMTDEMAEEVINAVIAIGKEYHA